MTHIEAMLSRALLVRERTVPRDVAALSSAARRRSTGTGSAPLATDHASVQAARDLRTLCETVISHIPATAVAEFVTDQVPEPRSALVLACVLQLTNTDDGARYWWQYAAGAGQPAAAYCLYLHHLALGERAAAAWWHGQTDHVLPPPEVPARAQAPTTRPAPSWFAHDPDASATSILRVLLHITRCTARPRPTAVTELMAYVPVAVAAGYLRQPDVELPVPGAGFARKIRTLLAAAANKPWAPDPFPARTDTHEHERDDSAAQAWTCTKENSETVPSQMGETATH